MADIEKVKKGIECCIQQGEKCVACSTECPYETIEMVECWVTMNKDALELLNEQEQLKVALSEGQRQVQSLLSSGRELEETINILKGEIKRLNELLKEQQPRVLTYKEAKELKAKTDIWMEHKRDRTITPLMFKSFTQGHIYKWFHFYGIETQSIKAMFYGSSVRFWTARPTEEQRKAVPWKDGEKE